MSDYAVSVKNISKKFNLFHEKRDSIYESAAGFFQKKRHSEILQALDDVSFNVKRGEIFGIIGRNGDGKTTLLRIISKIYTPDSGSVDVRGSIIPILAIGLGFHPELTAISNIYQSSILLGFNKDEITKRIPEIIKFAELERFADTKVKNFSSGMQLRLAFATSVLVDPDILIVDEVLAVGDVNFQKKCLDTIMSFKKRGKAIIFVSHSMSEVSKFCDTVMFLKEGKVGKIGSPKASIAAYKDYLAKHPGINPKENLSDSI
jgi:lipopolysaccharide transport system ATP-binding protein